MAVDPVTGDATGRVDFEGGGGVLLLPDKQRTLTEADIEQIEVPDDRTLATGPILRPLRKAVARYGRTLFVIGVPGQFTLETLCHVQGMERTLMDIIERPDFIRRWTEANLRRSIRIARAMAETGAQAFYIGETFGQFLSEDNFRDLCLPYFQEFVNALRSSGALIYLHMCGRITHLLGAIAETGVHCVEPLDELGGTRVAEVKQALGPHMALMGGVRTDLLARGSLDEVEADVRRCLAEAAGGGGFILAAGDMLPTETTPEKVHAMVRLAETAGRYPGETGSHPGR
jgi:uroporphyrinogen-III decarboxylase